MLSLLFSPFFSPAPSRSTVASSNHYSWFLPCQCSFASWFFPSAVDPLPLSLTSCDRSLPPTPAHYVTYPTSSPAPSLCPLLTPFIASSLAPFPVSSGFPPQPFSTPTLLVELGSNSRFVPKKGALVCLTQPSLLPPLFGQPRRYFTYSTSRSHPPTSSFRSILMANLLLDHPH